MFYVNPSTVLHGMFNQASGYPHSFELVVDIITNFCRVTNCHATWPIRTQTTPARDLTFQICHINRVAVWSMIVKPGPTISFRNWLYIRCGNSSCNRLIIDFYDAV